MNSGFTLLLMIFLHIVDDYYLQGWLASAKQRDWWKENAPQKLYKYDYIWALLMHAFSWSFMVMLPIAFHLNFKADVSFIVCFLLNMIIHALTDTSKANLKVINLWTDQLIHICQIFSIWMMFMVFA